LVGRKTKDSRRNAGFSHCCKYLMSMSILAPSEMT
jgi:hypothetical protein